MKIDHFKQVPKKINRCFMKTAVISAGASLANAGKHEIHAYNHGPAIVPGVGKTKEEGFSG